MPIKISFKKSSWLFILVYSKMFRGAIQAQMKQRKYAREV